MDLLHRKAQSYKVSNKNGLFCVWRDFDKTFCGISTDHKWMFKLQISSIFNFDQAHQSWICGVLGVKWSANSSLSSRPFKPNAIHNSPHCYFILASLMTDPCHLWEVFYSRMKAGKQKAKGKGEWMSPWHPHPFKTCVLICSPSSSER